VRRLRLITPLLSLLGVLAVSAPASSRAGETVVAPATSAPVEGAATTTTTTTGEAPGSTTGEAPTPTTAPEAEPVAPQVQSQHAQRPSSGSKPSKSGRASKPGEEAVGSEAGEVSARAKHKAVAPSALTPSLPLDLQSPIGSSSSFFIESFQIPPFLLPIFQAAGTAYGIPWQVLAAINQVETDYGRDLSVSSAGAEGWMQFLPAEWAQYGVDANGDGYEDPYNPADAIFTAARYLKAAGGDTNIRAAVFSYNHSQAYVESVMLRAQLLGGTPSELLGAITGLTEARFPVHAAAHFSDGFQTAPASGSVPVKTLVGTTIYSQAGAPVIAVQDGEVTQVGESPSLGKFVSLRDAYGNTYVYAQLGEVASVYPVLEPHEHSTVSRRIAHAGGKAEPRPSGPATAGAQSRSSISESAVVSGLSLGAAAGLETVPSTTTTTSASPASGHPSTPPKPTATNVRVFQEGPNDVYLNTLRPGVQVIAGTVLGRLGAATVGGIDGEASPHMLFQIRPAGLGAPLIDPKPILDGWVALENTSIFRAKGENPFLATSPTVGQVLLESQQQLEPQVLRDSGIRLSRCGREDVQESRVDKRVLALIEYLSVTGLKPTVSALKCPDAASVAAYAPASAGSDVVDISAIDGVPVTGHQGSGSLADSTVRKLLMLQGLNRPRRIVSLMSYPGAAGAVSNPSGAHAIHIVFAPAAAAGAHTASLLYSGLSPSEWSELIARLGEIPDPVVGHGPSSAAISDPSTKTAEESEAGGND
jgi:murein DD-endopeptidase MepM/ murein hydrolase activator NlpD